MLQTVKLVDSYAALAGIGERQLYGSPVDCQSLRLQLRPYQEEVRGLFYVLHAISNWRQQNCNVQPKGSSKLLNVVN